MLADAAGRPKDVASFIQSTTIRMCGLRGHGDEEGILADGRRIEYVATKFRSIVEDLQQQADGESQAASGAEVGST